MIEKFNLKEGVYYIGTCRNTNIAQWHNGEFIFINFNFNQPYIETVPYFGDVKEINTDGFIPFEEININFKKIKNERDKQDYKNCARRFYLNLKNDNLGGEIWKTIPEYDELYYVSNYGRIKNNSDLIMKQYFSKGYLVINLTKNKNQKICRVHRLVAHAFKNNSDLTLEVNHINGIKTDNRETNLEWVNHSQNAKHNYISGNIVKKLRPEDVVEIKKMLKKGCFQKDIAKKFKIAQSTVSEIKSGKKWVNIII